jgi:hypothetical protein
MLAIDESGPILTVGDAEAWTGIATTFIEAMLASRPMDFR